MKDLKNKLVLITGAGRGIGRLMAIDFAKEGSRLILWALHEEGLRKVATERSREYLKEVVDSDLETEDSKRLARQILDDLNKQQ